MQNNRILGHWLIVLILLISFVPSQTSSAQIEKPPNISDYTIIADQLKRFSTDMRPLLLEEEDNIIYSPLSYYLALLLLEPGLNADQQNLLDNALLPNNMEREDYFRLFEQFLADTMVREHAVFQTRTYLLGDLDQTWSKNFQTSIEDLAADLRLVDFSKVATYQKINEEIATFTQNLINPFYSDERINELSKKENLHLLVLNLLYYQGEWRTAFNDSLTVTASFFGKTNEHNVTMMTQTKQLNYMETEDFQATKLYYTNGAVFLVVLPKEKDQSINNEKMWQYYDEALNNEHHWVLTNVCLTLPKWRESVTLNLSESLNIFGLDSFKNNLSNTLYFEEESDIFLSEISQRIEFSLDEEGTQAAAVTEIIMETTAAIIEEDAPVEMTVNRPFIYRIAFSDLPLFEGLVQNLNK